MEKQLLVLANKIAETESNGNYNIANIVKYITEAYIVKGNTDITTGQPFMTSLTGMNIEEVIALSKRRRLYYNHSGGDAMGKYQFMPDTLISLATSLYGENYMQCIFNEQTQDALMIHLLKRNIKVLQNKNAPISERSIYLMHYFGDVSRTLHTLTARNILMSDILGEVSSLRNPYIASLRVEEFIKKKLAKYTTTPIRIPH
jgi:hypothetical protein